MNNRIEQKSKELVEQFIPFVRWKMGQEDYIEKAKQCAIICCDEIINNAPLSPVIKGKFYENYVDRLDDAIEHHKKIKEYIQTKL